MNLERDKFLTEQMDECWHCYESVHNTDGWDEKSSDETLDFKCTKCGDYQEAVHYKDHSGWAVKRENYYDFESWCFNNFSTWEGFGKLWEWSQKQEWWVGFMIDNSKIHPMKSGIINPDRFADAVYNYLKEALK